MAHFDMIPQYDKTLHPVDVLEAGVWYELSYKDHNRVYCFYRTFGVVDSTTLCSSLTTHHGVYHDGKWLQAPARSGHRKIMLNDEQAFHQVGMETAEYLTYHFCRLEREGKIKP